MKFAKELERDAVPGECITRHDTNVFLVFGSISLNLSLLLVSVQATLRWKSHQELGNIVDCGRTISSDSS